MSRSHKNYKTGDEAKYSDKVDEVEDEIVYPTSSKIVRNENEVPVARSLLTLNGKPFSAVHNDVLVKYFDEAPQTFDEFGFRIQDQSDSEDVKSDDTLLEDPQYRMKWLAHLQFKNPNLDTELTWGSVDISTLCDSKTTDLIKEGGIPHSMRAFLWPRFCGATVTRNSGKYHYERICQEADAEILTSATQIERDLLRTLPTNRCFSKIDALGITAMRRILRSLAFFYPELGYCQGMGTVVATLLLVCDEENVFWMMCKLIENYLPTSFYGDNLMGLQAEVKVLEHLVEVHMPGVSEKCKNSDTDISLILANWLLTLTASVFPMRILLRVWDLVFHQGISALYRALISIFKMNEEIILNSNLEDRPTGIFTFIQSMPLSVHNLDYLIDLMTTFEFSITDHTITSLRKTYQGSLNQNGLDYQIDTSQLKQRTQSRKLKIPKSFMSHIFRHSDLTMEDDPKTKNVRVTELIIDLKNAINQICTHFRACPQQHNDISTQADYSSSNVTNDREEFQKVRRLTQKHARAFIDFHGKDKDELSFKKNDIITIVSEKDEHCWVGELDGKTGWFPAKFAKVVEEKGKLYCPFGDENIAPKIGELVRNSLASAFLAIFYYGLRPSGIIVNANQTHPWHFIETFASALMEIHNNTTHSKLSLCDAFSLDQDGKLLSPEEILFRAVHFIGETHSAKFITNDVKFRSFVVCGLNEQCLHLWFEIFCSNMEQENLRQGYYQNWAFVRSPAWKQIKYELKLLCQFCFNLNLNFEVEQIYAIEKIRADQNNRTAAINDSKSVGPLNLSLTRTGCLNTSGSPPLKEEVRNMLIKHNLFSWDL